MKTIVDHHGNRLAKEKIEEKIATALLLLTQRNRENADQIRKMAEILRDHTPLSFFVSPTTDRLAHWVDCFYNFLRQRQDAVAVAFHPHRSERRGFLLTNCRDVPFLLHTVQLCLTRLGVRYQVVCHPIMSIQRQKGVLTALGRADRGELESFIVLELEDVSEARQTEVVDAVRRHLELVLLVDGDRDRLRQRLVEVAECAGSNGAFWNWLGAGAFLPLSYKQLELTGDSEDRSLRETPERSCGLPWKVVQFDVGEKRRLADLPDRFRTRLLRQTLEVVEESERSSPLYRDEKLVYIGFREHRDGMELEHAFLGLFAPEVEDDPALNVATLKERLEAALDRLCIPRGSHDHRKIVEIFNSFPKVELFFISDDELTRLVHSFTQLYRHESVRVVPAHSLAVRGLTLLVIMPRVFYGPMTSPRLDAFLRRFFRTEQIESRIIHLSKSYLSLHVGVQTGAFDIRFDEEKLERGLTRICRPWELTLRRILERNETAEKAESLWRRYRESFTPEYKHLFHPRFAVRDIRAMERLLENGRDTFEIWGPVSGREEIYRLQFYSRRQSFLNELMPFLENLGLNVIDEVDFRFVIDGAEVFLKSFAIRGGEGSLPLSPLRHKLVAALDALRAGEAENDYLNRLLVLTGLDWREIDVFRAYRNYYFQLGSRYTKRRVAFALISNPRVAQLLYRYFEARFRPDPQWEDPAEREEQVLSPLRLELVEALQGVRDPNEDEILRVLFNLIDSTIRTNFFVRRDAEDYFIAFKLSALGIIDMPAPRPLYETYVHNARMEGIHLRGGKVARGGIRWSDRPDDFRTEILDLMKTQMTKNALIVPVGSKGGFIVKTPFSTREEGMELSKRAYQTLMRGLLDLSDNRVDGQIRRPEGIVAYDGDDPYLVVAADKGTAHLPDTANAISAEYGFWLGDAFASGGSKGYDHKKLGITARGAWESVKRHFRELGVDVQSESVTVVGIGDMSGDVFGNGMLLSRKIKLLAAFNHMHIFLDPDPDPETSWQERKRLFDMPRSTWEDYDPKLISPGGGVFRRDAKDIPLSPQVREWLGVRHESIDPNGLIRLLLAADVDLIWNGGIGTYVKASFEKHVDAGDRANDPVRIDATELRARVVGEGGNLGMTQFARIEYALHGGRLNTDAIDNSGGVDCSDHEVNLKIFLHHLMTSGEVEDLEDRDRLLEEVTDEVCRLVLHNNYTQSLCLSLDLERCREDVGPFLDLCDRLVDVGLLDREGENLPSAKVVHARASRSFVRPELSKLLAYAKMQLYQNLLESDLVQTDLAFEDLASYFPQQVRKRFGRKLAGHPLAREIVATVMTNRIIDQAGCAFCDRLARATGSSLTAVAGAYLFADRLFDASSLRLHVYQQDNRMPAEQQHRLLRLIEDALARFCQRALVSGFDLPYRKKQVRELKKEFDSYLQQVADTPQAETDLFAGLPDEVAAAFARLLRVDHFLPAVVLARGVGRQVADVLPVYLELYRRLDLDSLLSMLDRMAVRDRWDRLARETLRAEFVTLGTELAARVFTEAGGDIDRYLSPRRTLLQVYRGQRKRLGESLPDNLHPLMVLAGSLGRLLQG
ncbi:glutamate dehydrogenase (NAD) [Geothermobacter ehrlichii]|uniref:Glutamate dehydrogenase (NAD) n=1 Tax=Geothermobacter ehrlichii TaxID=213224 RepID=A0A5D3WKV3_9BACT|nr:NAD-glutamate dehydrogenase domain-containing protein [Geothermobacter ehrlichii]TYO99634.1 glutamate dehydrogenase (NAD) [Geothermobacter ehrlichii]